MNHDFATKGIPGKAALQAMGLDVIGIIPKRNNWYPEKSLLKAKEDLRNVLESYEVRTAYGSSMGGYGAIKYSSLLNCNYVLSLAPQFSIDPSDVGKRDTRFIANFSSKLHPTMRIKKEDIQGSLTVIYDPMCKLDAFHAEKILALHQGETVPAFFCDHFVINPIASRQTMKEIFNGIFSGDNGEVRSVYRSARKNSDYYKASLMRYFAKKRARSNDLSTAVKAINQAISYTPNNAEIYVDKCRIHLKNSDQERAIKAIRKAIDLDPNREWYKKILANTMSSMP